MHCDSRHGRKIICVLYSIKEIIVTYPCAAEIGSTDSLLSFDMLAALYARKF